MKAGSLPSSVMSRKLLPKHGYSITTIYTYRTELKNNARDALISAIDFYIEDRKAFPVGSTVKSGEIAIELPASVVAKVLLLNTMVQANVRPIDLARKMKVKPQEVTRLTDIRHATKIDTIQKALRALGKELVITLR